MTIRLICLFACLAGACTPDDTNRDNSPDVGSSGQSDMDVDNSGQPDASNTGPSVRGDQTYTFALLSTDDQLEVADFEPEFDEGACPTACDANTAPSLGEPVFVVNGTVTPTLTATTNDDITIFVPFTDAECNLGCGMRSDSHQEPQGGGDSAASLPSNLPCSTDESDVYLRVTPGSLPLDAGAYSYTLWIEDGCGARSSTTPLEFELESE